MLAFFVFMHYSISRKTQNGNIWDNEIRYAFSAIQLTPHIAAKNGLFQEFVRGICDSGEKLLYGHSGKWYYTIL